MTDDLKHQLRLLIIQSLDLEDIAPSDIADDMLLFSPDGLGLDSVDALELGLALQKTFGFNLESSGTGLREHFQSINTLAAWVQMNQS